MIITPFSYNGTILIKDIDIAGADITVTNSEKKKQYWLRTGVEYDSERTHFKCLSCGDISFSKHLLIAKQIDVKTCEKLDHAYI